MIDAEQLNKPCYELANFLLSKLLVRKWDNIITKGRIVETECYLGGEDKASNTYNGRYVSKYHIYIDNYNLVFVYFY